MKICALTGVGFHIVELEIRQTLISGSVIGRLGPAAGSSAEDELPSAAAEREFSVDGMVYYAFAYCAMVAFEQGQDAEAVLACIVR